MGSINLLQWRKSYMLEFLDEGELVECFTFSVPPESEEFDFPQRITETKTFGGSVFDDYGNDSYRITLSGSTVNEEKKLVYKGKNKAPLYLTGTKEIFELQKIIKNWSEGVTVSGFFRKTVEGIKSDRKVYLYDLSKMSVLQAVTGTASRNYWRVFINDLKIKRDKSKPKTYNYTLEMIGVEDTGVQSTGLLPEFSDAVDSIQNAMDFANSVMEITEAVMAAGAEIADCCNRAKAAYKMMLSRKNGEKNDGELTTLAVMSGFDTVSRILGGDSDSFYNSTKELLHAVSGFRALAIDENMSGIRQKGSIQNTSVFTITFDSNGGSSVKSQTVEYSNTASKPADPVKPDFSFEGWYSDSGFTRAYDFNEEVTENITLFAKWILAVATVTFNSRNGSQVAPLKVEVGSTVEEPDPPVREGYAFDMWCTDYEGKNAFDFSIPVTGNIVLYASWRKTYSVVFNPKGGSEVKTQTVNIGELVVYPMTPTKENHVFACWCSDADLQNAFDFSEPVTQDIVLHALWVQVSNTVVFDSQGGSDVESQRIAIGGYAEEPAAPVKEGYAFVFWTTDKEGTNEFRFKTTQVKRGITLYAKWAEREYEVSFDTVGGSKIEPQIVKHGRKAVFPDIPIKDSYSFRKWQVRRNVEESGGYEYEEYDFNLPVTESFTLYALWFGGGSND